MKTYIKVNLQVEGIHQREACPLEDVGFLRSPHRHIFHISCMAEVGHNDREIEIIRFKRAILKYLHDKYGDYICEFDNMSCEMIATELVEQFNLYSCEVLEDAENGAVVLTS